MPCASVCNQTADLHDPVLGHFLLAGCISSAHVHHPAGQQKYAGLTQFPSYQRGHCWQSLCQPARPPVCWLTPQSRYGDAPYSPAGAGHWCAPSPSAWGTS